MSEQHFLLINPNTNAAVTARLEQTLAPMLPSSVQLHSVTARFGASYIACEASWAVAAHATLDAWAEFVANSGHEPAGVLIGCFGDPGLFALRESANCAVTGLAEASFIEASRYGRFAIVTGGERWGPMLQRLADNLGFGGALCAIETVAPSGAQMLADPALARSVLTEAIGQASAQGAQAIIIGGAGLAGYAEMLQGLSPVPLIDSAKAGLSVLLRGELPKPRVQENRFVAQWTSISNEMAALARVR